MDQAASDMAAVGAAARRQNAISLLLLMLICLAFVVRFAIAPEIVNMFMAYTDDPEAGGAIYEKFHWGTYAIVLLVPVAVMLRPILLTDEETPKFRALVRYCAAMIAFAAFTMLSGRAGGIGYIIDTYLVAGLCGVLMYCVNQPTRRIIGQVVLVLLLFGALVGIVEAVTGTRINPYGAMEDVFRPTGIFDHPLSLGLICATAIGCAAAAPWRVSTRLVAIFLLFVGAAASEARFATLLAIIEILVILMFVPWPRLTPVAEKKAKALVLVFVVAGGAVLIGALIAGGLLSRFSSGLVDENFFARLTIYRIFELTSLSDIILGADLEEIVRIVNTELNLPYIESSPVVLIYQFGLPLALVFAGLLVMLFARLLAGAQMPIKIATGVFFLAALSSNTLTTKTPLVAIIVVLIIAFGPAFERRRE
jgi:hypothetical protein